MMNSYQVCAPIGGDVFKSEVALVAEGNDWRFQRGISLQALELIRRKESSFFLRIRNAAIIALSRFNDLLSIAVLHVVRMAARHEQIKLPIEIDIDEYWLPRPLSSSH